MLRMLFLILLLFRASQFFAQTADCFGAVQTNKGEFSNFYQVSENLFRSEQPKTGDWQVLNECGVVTVINLRRRDTNASAPDGKIKKIHLPMRAGKIESAEIAECLRIIRDTSGRCLVHCLHGSDRTGCVIACYRMVFCQWTREQAIEEFLEKRFAYHRFWFPGILRFLEEVDIDQLKKQII